MALPIASALSSVKNGSLRDAVIRSVRKAIFSGQFPPGAPLREVQLARDLGVSQATVREALLQLEHAGLVVRTPNVGTAVTKMSPKELRERVSLRVLLETQAGVEAAERMKPEEYAELEERLRELSARVEENDYDGTAQADLAFHRALWRKADNDVLYRLLDQLTVPLFAFISIVRSNGLQSLPGTVRSHDPILVAMRTRDSQAITEAFRAAIEPSYIEFSQAGQSAQHALALGLME